MLPDSANPSLSLLSQPIIQLSGMPETNKSSIQSSEPVDSIWRIDLWTWLFLSDDNNVEVVIEDFKFIP